MCEHGFAALTVEAIARRAGVAKQTSCSGLERAQRPVQRGSRPAVQAA
ncbi:TetR family transcriptional regulator [Amycolatopsis sp. NPDC003731]